jgi:hypothetical protein
MTKKRQQTGNFPEAISKEIWYSLDKWVMTGVKEMILSTFTTQTCNIFNLICKTFLPNNKINFVLKTSSWIYSNWMSRQKLWWFLCVLSTIFRQITRDDELVWIIHKHLVSSSVHSLIIYDTQQLFHFSCCLLILYLQEDK